MICPVFSNLVLVGLRVSNIKILVTAAFDPRSTSSKKSLMIGLAKEAEGYSLPSGKKTERDQEA
jgi:hypothetical protein